MYRFLEARVLLPLTAPDTSALSPHTAVGGVVIKQWAGGLTAQNNTYPEEGYVAEWPWEQMGALRDKQFLSPLREHQAHVGTSHPVAHPAGQGHQAVGWPGVPCGTGSSLLVPPIQRVLPVLPLPWTPGDMQRPSGTPVAVTLCSDPCLPSTFLPVFQPLTQQTFKKGSLGAPRWREEHTASKPFLPHGAWRPV